MLLQGGIATQQFGNCDSKLLVPFGVLPFQREKAKTMAQTKEELKKSVERAMHRLQKLPDMVAGFFGAPTCAYAKA